MTVVPDVLVDIASRYPEAEGQQIERAYAVALYWHRDQMRRSGDPYITHSLAVAAILAGLGMDAAMVCAGLLHEVSDDTLHPGCPRNQLRTEFGAEVANLVEGLADLKRRGTVAGVERRVLILNLADQLHNMQTIRWVDRANQEHKSRETLDILVPLAGELGLDAIGTQLERLALATLHPSSFVIHSGHSRGVRVSRRVLTVSAVLLPTRARARWLEEWVGELHTLPGRRARARFTLQILGGMCRLAIVLRRTANGKPTRQ